MHFARIEKSPRLMRVLRVLSDGLEHSTMNIARNANVCAVNSAVSEIREQGYKVACRQSYERGRRVWRYRMTA